MGVFEIIGKIILGIIFFAVTAYVFSFLMGLIAKLFNANISYRGATIGTPDQIDQDIEEIKKIRNAALNRLKSAISAFQSRDNKQSNVSEKLRLLKELEELKVNQALSEIQYYELKSEILK